MDGLAIASFYSFFVIIFAVIVLYYIISIFNGLINLRNNIKKAWANIDVLLVQRSDLIPNLVEIVKGYQMHEQYTLEEVTRLRAMLVNDEGPAAKAKTSDAISSSIRTIFAVAENYPNLKASKIFMNLQERLSLIEDQISDRREFYNNSVLLYNTRIHSFPDLIFAMIFGFKENEYFKAKDEEKEVVDVDMTNNNPGKNN